MALFNRRVLTEAAEKIDLVQHVLDKSVTASIILSAITPHSFIIPIIMRRVGLADE